MHRSKWGKSLLLLVLVLVAGNSAAPAPIQVACVGDSITAGYLASNSSMTYPGELQMMLDGKYGTGMYNVHNFGAGGATVQKGADSPYWNRTQFSQFVNGSYDIIIIMLGTNDAKDPGNGGAPNWPDNCTAPYPTADNCTVIQDYLSLIALAKDKARRRPPLMEATVAIMRPPPLWRDSDYGMNQTILNDVMPRLVPEISTLAGLHYPPIDVYTALGGSSNWRNTFPTCGCQLQKSAEDGDDGNAVNFTATEGYLPMGGDYAVGNFTFREAVEECGKAVGCAAFTFRSNGSSTPAAPVHMYLKQCNNGLHKVDGWWSWLKPPNATPAHNQPTSCALFCDAQSCDGCHPNNNGYRVLAQVVFRFITSVH